MNERLKDLYAECVNPYGEFRYEKFAELIVKECADYVQFYYKDIMCEYIAHDMKQHFGVEE